MAFMEENVAIFTYSVADLKNWLLHNRPVNGLSPEIIAPTRAFAIINNPFVTDETRVVCALFVNDKLVAYTAAFPEVLQKPENRLAWWFTTLWCDEKYGGRGFGLVVVGTLCELIGEGNFFDAEGARETVEIFRLLGLKSTYIPRYEFVRKRIHTDTIRGKIAWCREAFSQKICERRRKSLMHQKGSDSNYVVKYTRFVDEEAYAFIVAHSDKDVLLRKQEMFDWILQYPFAQVSPLLDHTPFDNKFSSTVKDYLLVCCKIVKDDQLIGVAILSISGGGMSVRYLYYEQQSAKTVFRAIVDHLLSLQIKGFETNDAKLADYVISLRIFTKNYIIQKSFSYPHDFVFSNDKGLQAGEGDMFV
jgi:hypothetical protein